MNAYQHKIQRQPWKVVTVFYVWLVWLSACSAEKSVSPHFFSTETYSAWTLSTTKHFIASSQETINIEDLHTDLNMLLSAGKLKTDHSPSPNSLVLSDHFVLTSIPELSPTALENFQGNLQNELSSLSLLHPAQQTLTRQSLDMLNTYLFSLFGQQATQFTALSVSELDDLPAFTPTLNKQVIEDRKKLITELVALNAKYTVLNDGKISVYHHTQDTQTFAFSRTNTANRAYIAFNFSYETQALPMPLGFMASTKVTLWQSDTQGTHQFVTRQPIYMRPFTVTIVIVG